MEFEVIITKRLKLRKLTQEVYDFVFESYTDDELCAFLGLETTAKLQVEKDKYAANLSSYNRSFVFFQLIHKEDDKIIGGAGFHNYYVDHARAEVGYSITNDDYKRQGLMSEALTAIIAFGFNTLQLHRIEAFVGSRNEASLLLMRKMNFTQEGLMREHYFIDDVYEDSLVFSLLRSEYL